MARGPDIATIRARLENVRRALAEKRLGGYLLTDLSDIRYLSGFTGSSALVVLTGTDGYFLTDPRYELQAAREVRGLKVRVFKKDGAGYAARVLKRLATGPVGFKGSSVSVELYARLKKAIAPLRLKSAPGVVSGARLLKDRYELTRIAESAGLLDRGFVAVKRYLRPGTTEREAAFRAETFLKGRGADALAFETIVASGARGALPHGKASDKVMRAGELVTVDMGVRLNGYNSDCTRTFCIGRPNARQKKVYGAVLDALLDATEKVRAGAPAATVDRAARRSIARAGYGKYFTHSTGHGVGLVVHEGPVVGPKSKDVLEEGMVVTVEPGIYIPGWGGVRIEDMVAVTKDGPLLLTKTARELICL